MLLSGCLKTICPLRSSGTAMNSRPSSAMSPRVRHAAWVADDWEVLGVRRGASPQDVRARWRALAKELHPDLGGGADAAARLAEVNAAYQRLRLHAPDERRAGPDERRAGPHERRAGP